MEAGEERSVVQRLREKGLIPIRIGAGSAVVQRAERAIALPKLGRKSVKTAELLIFMWIPTFVSHRTVANPHLVATDLLGLLVTVAAVFLLTRFTNLDSYVVSGFSRTGTGPPREPEKKSAQL